MRLKESMTAVTLFGYKIMFTVDTIINLNIIMYINVDLLMLQHAHEAGQQS